jgi:hypothetical protein
MCLQGDDDLTTEEQETTVFENLTVPDTYSFPTADSAIFDTDMQDKALLGPDFFNRPLLIHTLSWIQGGHVPVNFDPWTLYLNNAFIKYKLNNFAFLRGNLHLKFVINSSPFYYGRMAAIYTPLPYQTHDIIGGPVGLGLIPYSQRPHVWINPHENAGGEMSLPFIYPLNYVNITSATDIVQLGLISMVEYVQLLSANGATADGVTIQVYAWLEDPVLMGPTVGLAMQGADEYGNGPVSAPATAVAKWASYLYDIPIIGRFAKATGIGASAISNIAMLFGWSNVPVIEDVKPIKNLPFHDMASAHISEPTTKFLLDPKGELSVDPAIVGLPSQDELSIPYLVTKESYLCSKEWNCSDAIGTLLFSAKVCPHMFGTAGADIAGTYVCAATPMHYLSLMFKNWRGDIKFKFVIVASKYHKGRVRFTWDPISSITATTDFSHLAFTKIIDLSIENEIEIIVPYMQAFPWLETTDALSAKFNVDSALTPVIGLDNGSVTLRVLTALTAPIDVAPVTIQTFVSGCNNLEFANPIDISRQFSLLAMQGSDEVSTPLEERYLINYGEAIPSLRTLLRRSTYYDSVIMHYNSSGSSKGELTYFLQSRRPAYTGYDFEANTTAKGAAHPLITYYYNFVTPTPVAHVMAMFIGYRGSFKWHFNHDNAGGALIALSVVRQGRGALTINSAALEGSTVVTMPGTVPSYSTLKKNVVANTYPAGASGMFITHQQTQTGISVELPMMTNRKFCITSPLAALRGVAFDGSDTDLYRVNVNSHPNVSPTTYTSLARYVSIGTDFNAHFFLNAPMLFYNATMGNTPV